MIIRDCLLVIFIDKADRFGYLYRIVNVGWSGAGPGEEPTRVCRKEESLIDGMEWWIIHGWNVGRNTEDIKIPSFSWGITHSG